MGEKVGWRVGGKRRGIRRTVSGDGEGEGGGRRGALAAFGRGWGAVSAEMLRGGEHPTVRFGGSSDRSELGGWLGRRAQIIEDWAVDDEMWQ